MTGAEHLQQRNEVVVTTVHDAGLHVGELTRVDVEFLHNDNSGLHLPTGIQKDYPNEHSPPPVTLECSDDAT